MQLHWPGFGQTRCSIESVNISALANWFIKGKSQKKRFCLYKNAGANRCIYGRMIWILFSEERSES